MDNALTKKRLKELLISWDAKPRGLSLCAIAILNSNAFRYQRKVQRIRNELKEHLQRNELSTRVEIDIMRNLTLIEWITLLAVVGLLVAVVGSKMNQQQDVKKAVQHGCGVVSFTTSVREV